MISKFDGATVQMKSVTSQEVKDAEFQIAHFAPVHYAKTPDMFNVFYVIEDKLSHVPFAVSDSKTELQIYADLNGMKLSEYDEGSLI